MCMYMHMLSYTCTLPLTQWHGIYFVCMHVQMSTYICALHRDWGFILCVCVCRCQHMHTNNTTDTGTRDQFRDLDVLESKESVHIYMSMYVYGYVYTYTCMYLYIYVCIHHRHRDKGSIWCPWRLWFEGNCICIHQYFFSYVYISRCTKHIYICKYQRKTQGQQLYFASLACFIRNKAYTQYTWKRIFICMYV